MKMTRRRILSVFLVVVLMCVSLICPQAQAKTLSEDG